jgi:hypothetical protein
MYYSLSEEQEKYLLSQPETGMGYQITEVQKVGTYLKKNYIILNSEVAIDLDNSYGMDIKKIINEGILIAKMLAPKAPFPIGGEEVFFESGTSERTFIGESKY